MSKLDIVLKGIDNGFILSTQIYVNRTSRTRTDKPWIWANDQAITAAHRTTVSLTAEDDFLIVLKTKCVWGEITFKELKQTFLIWSQLSIVYSLHFIWIDIMLVRLLMPFPTRRLMGIKVRTDFLIRRQLCNYRFFYFYCSRVWRLIIPINTSMGKFEEQGHLRDLLCQFTCHVYYL